MQIKGTIKENTFNQSHIIISKEELLASARTLVDKPVTLDFGSTIIGKVVDAEYIDGTIEYIAEMDELPRGYENKLRAEINFRSLENGDRVKGITFVKLSLVKDEDEVS